MRRMRSKGRTRTHLDVLSFTKLLDRLDQQRHVDRVWVVKVVIIMMCEIKLLLVQDLSYGEKDEG